MPSTKRRSATNLSPMVPSMRVNPESKCNFKARSRFSLALFPNGHGRVISLDSNWLFMSKVTGLRSSNPKLSDSSSAISAPPLIVNSPSMGMLPVTTLVHGKLTSWLRLAGSTIVFMKTRCTPFRFSRFADKSWFHK